MKKYTSNEYTLSTFIQACRTKISEGDCPADYVAGIVPEMYRLLNGDKSFLKPEHFVSSPDGYARNLIYRNDDESLSLFSLVWLPGQWTPIHDHGTWGVVGVLESTLEERSYIRTDKGADDATTNIQLARGSVIMLCPGAVTSFVPNPDHIHLTGNASTNNVVSLHLYGRTMSGFHVYDRSAGTRKYVEVAHNES